MVADENATPKRGGGMQLYVEHLPQSEIDSPPGDGKVQNEGDISRQEHGQNVQSSTGDREGVKKTFVNASLQFQPIRRPQHQSSKQKPKKPMGRIGTVSARFSSSGNLASTQPTGGESTAASSRFTIDALTREADDAAEQYLDLPKPQRGGRKKRKREDPNSTRADRWSWNDVYDPEKPNSHLDPIDDDYADPLLDRWRAYLHRPSRVSIPLGASSDEEAGSLLATDNTGYMDDQVQGYGAEEAQIRSSTNLVGTQALSSSDTAAALTYPSETVASHLLQSSTNSQAQDLTQAVQASTMIYSGEAVRYDLSNPAQHSALAVPAQTEVRDPKATADAVHLSSDTNSQFHGEVSSARPGQKGFAARLLAKQGWTKGMGLGRSGSGIVNPLRVEMEKRLAQSDDGQRPISFAAKGKIIGSRKGVDDTEANASELPSRVVVFPGLIAGQELEMEQIEDRHGESMSRIGKDAEAKFGPIERIYVHENGESRLPVFVKFASQSSALRAVMEYTHDESSKGYGPARFYAVEKFDDGNYESA